MSEQRIEHQLSAIGDEAFPPTPQLAEAVIAGISLAPRVRRRWVPAVAVAAAVLVAVLAFPASRQAVARWLGIGGVAIEQVSEHDFPATELTDAPLGDRVALDEVKDVVGFEPVLPDVDGVAEPTVYVRPDIAGGLVTLTYRNEGEGPGLVVTQFRTEGEVAIKQLTGGATFREVRVGDANAFWIEGTHTIAFFDDAGEIRQDAARLVGNTLVWQAGGLTVRIESALQLDEVLEIAESLDL